MYLAVANALGRRYRSLLSFGMKARIFWLCALASAAALGGCANPRATVPVVNTHSASRFEAYLATLRVGMVPQEAAPDLICHGGFPVFTTGLHMRHQRAYSFLDGGVVTLEFDGHDKLASWTFWEEVRR